MLRCSLFVASFWFTAVAAVAKPICSDREARRKCAPDGWCVVICKGSGVGGYPEFSGKLIHPDGQVTDIDEISGVEEPYFVLGSHGHLAVDSESGELETAPAALNPHFDEGTLARRNKKHAVAENETEGDSESAPVLPSVGRAAIKTCHQVHRAKHPLADAWGCNSLGCAVEVLSGGSHSDPAAPFCIAWVPHRGEGQVVGWVPVTLGYSPNIDLSLSAHSLRVSGQDCNHGIGCWPEFSLFVKPDPRRVPRVGEIPRVGSPSKADDLLPYETPLVAQSLRDVRAGVFDWKGPRDSSARFTFALADDVLRVDAEIVDDVIGPCTGEVRDVNCDHLEIVVKGGAQAGALLAIVPRAGDRAELRRWREPGGHETDLPLKSSMCQWSTSAGTGRSHGSRQLVRCEIPRDLICPKEQGETLAIELRYSDADRGSQKVLIGKEVTLHAEAVFPPRITKPLTWERSEYEPGDP